jgi:hypothetical protein
MRRPILLAATLLTLLLPSARAQELAAFEPDSMDKIMASHQGQPFVLVLWSMDCAFCQVSLDLLSKARRAHPQLRVVTISTDPVDDAELTAQAGKRLAALGLARDAWAFGQASPERLRHAIDPRWRGEKPRTYWFDRQGRRTAYSGVLDTAMIEKFAR